MSDVDWPTAIFDQSGQLVDLQYNASTISVVNNLADGANGKKCPKCNASPMFRTQLVWEENTRRHKQGMMLLTNIARRVAPPGRPSRPFQESVSPPRRSNGPYKVAALSALASLVAGPIASKQLEPTIHLPALGLPVITLLIAVLWLWSAARSRKQRWDRAVADSRARNQHQMTRYEAAVKSSRARLNQWRNSWFCKSCSAIVSESRGQKKPKARPNATRGKQRLGGSSR